MFEETKLLSLKFFLFFFHCFKEMQPTDKISLESEANSSLFDISGEGRVSKDYKSLLCMKEFLSNFSLIQHKKTHTGDRPFPCETCGAKFSRNSSLVIHIRKHTGEKPFQCGICVWNFQKIECLHENTHWRKTIPL